MATDQWTALPARQPLTEVPERVQVRAWFGPHLICEYAASLTEAQAYADTVPYRFLGLRVTIADLDPDESPAPLPPRQLWSLTVG